MLNKGVTYTYTILRDHFCVLTKLSLIKYIKLCQQQPSTSSFKHHHVVLFPLMVKSGLVIARCRIFVSCACSSPKPHFFSSDIWPYSLYFSLYLHRLICSSSPSSMYSPVFPPVIFFAISRILKNMSKNPGFLCNYCFY